MLVAVPASGADADKAAAKAHYEAATRLYDIKEWAKALDEYKAAYLSKPDPAFLFNIGQCYRKLGKHAQALDFYREYLKKTDTDDPNRASVETRVREMEAGDVFENEAPASPPPLSAPESAPSVQYRAPTPHVEERPATPAAELPSPVPAEGSPPVPQLSQPDLSVPAPAQPAQAPGLDVTVTEPVAQRETGGRFYKTWWFWTGVGAVVVAGTVGILAATSGTHGQSADTALGTQAVFE